jgi:hypothetical protein
MNLLYYLAGGIAAGAGMVTSGTGPGSPSAAPRAEGTPADDQRRGPRVLLRPLDKRALGAAIGIAAGLVVFTATALYVLRGPPGESHLELLAQYFTGYSVSWAGAFIGAAWAGFTGFVLGWFVAFVRNAVMGLQLMLTRARADLFETRDFLDHI